MMKYFLPLIIFAFPAISPLLGQTARIYEETRTMVTYPFFDPDPVPAMGRIYPYFRFDGFSNTGQKQNWKMVVLENDYIKVFITPEIGGKIWGAIEKSTGGEFLYFNEVVKFRDIAMRGPWTSGGLEYNFGDIGHIPTASTPVDYRTLKNEDGSVSCILGAIDLPSRTKWNVAVNLYPGKAFVETVVTWHNATDLPVTYYHWMNAAAKADGNLEFLYPGTAYIGHNGEVSSFPVEKGRKISFYENNNFGSYKSYHVLNAYSNFFGGYWHDDDFGFGHLGSYDDKPGKKIWIWGLSDQGMIWEDLLTDNDGQYIEYQSGKLFNQAAEGSTLTPFKHREFAPHDTDHMIDRWFPLKGTGGMVAASEYGVLNAERAGERLTLKFSPLQPTDQQVTLTVNGQYLLDTVLRLQPLELFTRTIDLPAESHFQFQLGEKLLFYSSEPSDLYVDRPLAPNPDFDWNSPYGLFTRGLEYEKQREYLLAHQQYLDCLEKEPAFAPALNRLALSHYRRMEYDEAYALVLRSLAIDTYDPEANYLFGLINEHWEKQANAKSGYSVAAQDPGYRVPGFTALARMYLKEGDHRQARRLCGEALSFNSRNVAALEMLALINRINNDRVQAGLALAALEAVDPTSAFLAYERDLWAQTSTLSSLITNELADESYLELALLYLRYGRKKEGLDVLKMIPDHPIALLWRASLDSENKSALLSRALSLSPAMVFPHRLETLHMLEKWMAETDHWKLKYYAALIYWSKGRIDRARQLFESCREAPDFAPFYLAKATFFQEDEGARKRAMERALRIDPGNWRANLEFAGLCFAEEKYSEAEAIASRFLDTSPAFGMLYAKVLIRDGSAAKAVSFLENYEILPFEGAREARQVYHEACIRASLEAFGRGDYPSAVNFAEKAGRWPRNLGVGKPYAVDERMEQYILAKTYGKMAENQQAARYRDLVLQYYPEDGAENANLIFQALLLKADGQGNKVKELVDAALGASPDDPDLQWVAAALADNTFLLPEGAGDHLKLVGEVLKVLRG